MIKVYIHTFGCQMNEYDSERMLAALAQAGGFLSVNNEAEADVVIVNTCSVRKHAEERAMSYIGRHVKDRKVIVAGCMAQNLKDGLKRQFPGLHAVVGTSSFDEIADIILSGGVFTQEGKDAYSLRLKRPAKVRAFLAVMRGCDNFCSYCIVPHVRGREQSRPYMEILDEASMLASAGTKEITLLGQNVNSYMDSGTDFPDLLAKLAGIAGIKRIRFMTSHPKDLGEKLVATVAGNTKICRHIHFPAQSGSDRILALMNRKYTAAEYCRKVAMIREKIPGCAVTTDFLLGFPSETGADFMETARMAEELRFDDAYIFKYSSRPGTAAADMDDDVPEAEKKRRVNYLLDLQKKISEDINKSLVNTV
ncbi:MAG TPA: tRNA (N6-isopentenyl adenosine(37)-C2)-methylthiotransferase MiaB, partial [Candidatus Goldiibacteriota bacterium]|nr:tRNA (N6-isopentenyl adenosine(37)-C2)-methylthiotransferase MiaB [Candidatus Goldiibacteriota bacterium]